MKINALTVSVNYADELAYSIDRWRGGLDSWVVVTDRNDFETVRLCESRGVMVYQTDAFYAGGALFNKGAAMEQARQHMPWRDWILFIDADVVPPLDWRSQLVGLEPGNLYGARRRECPDPSMIDAPNLPRPPSDSVGVGFFQLFHSDDDRVQQTPLIDTGFFHAGCYDSVFMHLWPNGMIKPVPFELVHIGERDNWCGKGNHAAFDAMMADRQRRGGWQHERTIGG